jgi:hypothetical protein
MGRFDLWTNHNWPQLTPRGSQPIPRLLLQKPRLSRIHVL